VAVATAIAVAAASAAVAAAEAAKAAAEQESTQFMADGAANASCIRCGISNNCKHHVSKSSVTPALSTCSFHAIV